MDIKPLREDLSRPLIMAGPCSAESEEQVMLTARALADAGVRVFRAGIWKPRTMPGGFEGVGECGLEWLARAKRETGMLIATEVATRTHVEQALNAGVDMLWIGARTSANPFAVQDIADALKERGEDVPVLIKNPVSPDLELWIGAIKRIYNAGIHRIAAVHRGFSSYGNSGYRNEPLWRIPIELHRRYPQIPIICDPSHIGGKRELIEQLSQRAMDMDFDGLIIEVHCNPEQAMSDASQQITPEELERMLKSLQYRSRKEASEELKQMRREIDILDEELLDVIRRRMEVSQRIGEFKREHMMPVVQIGRHDEIMQHRMREGERMGINSTFTRRLMSLIHEESVNCQLRKD